MIDTAEALFTFFSGFGLPAYVEYNVPENAALPYITYQLREPEPGEQCSLTARVWYMDTGLEAISRKVKEIRDAVFCGVPLPVPGGEVWLWPEKNFAQIQPVDEPKLKVAYLSLIIGVYAF